MESEGFEANGCWEEGLNIIKLSSRGSDIPVL